MKLRCTYYKTTGKYYGEDEWPITNDEVEELKKKYGSYDFEGIKDYIIEHANYHNPKQFHWVVELIDQPHESQVFCQFLQLAREA